MASECFLLFSDSGSLYFQKPQALNIQAAVEALPVIVAARWRTNPHMVVWGYCQVPCIGPQQHKLMGSGLVPCNLRLESLSAHMTSEVWQKSPCNRLKACLSQYHAQISFQGFHFTSWESVTQHGNHHQHQKTCLWRQHSGKGWL